MEIEDTGPGNVTIVCNVIWDGLVFWPVTPADTIAVVPCFAEFNGVKYDTTRNASRHCQYNGTWEERTNYSDCMPLQAVDKKVYQDLWNMKEAQTVYFCGYCLSMVALMVALCIFLYFKDLRCVRNTIHMNLMVTYVLFELTWIANSILNIAREKREPTSNEAVSEPWCIFSIFLTYFLGTNFFWMFVEGLYLYVLVVKTFSMELVNIHIYAFIGWGLPALIVLIWAPIKLLLEPEREHRCPWHSRNVADYIFVVPQCLVLTVNTYFLQRIMWVLITKLRAATSVESKQYRKAAKALLVLIPLLGLTYILTLRTPKSGTAEVVVIYLQATLQSTQGFFVAVSYCFLNGEVRNSVRHHFQRWRSLRNLRGGKCHNSSRTFSSYVHNNSEGRDTGHGQRQLSNGSGAPSYDPVNTLVREDTL